MWWNGKALVIGDPDLTIETDASPLGWGAVCNGVRTGAFGHNPRDYSASTAFVVKAHKTQVRVLLLMDNVTAVTYINKMGGTRSPILSSLTFELWTWCLQRQTTIIARHIPGTLKPPGRPGIAHCCRPFRLETQTRDFSMYLGTLGSSRNRSLCIPPVAPDPKVRKLETRPSGGSSECFYPRLDSVEGVCLSPFRISGEMSEASHSPTSPEIGYNSSSM